MTPLQPSELCARKEQTCLYHSEEGCCNSLIDDREKVLEVGRCIHARFGEVFGTMTPDAFTPDDTDPNGLVRAAPAVFGQWPFRAIQ